MEKKLIVIAAIARVTYLLSVLKTEVEKETLDKEVVMARLMNTRENFELLYSSVIDLTAGA